MSQQMYIDCRVAGSNGDAVRVVAVVDKQNDTLSIAKLLPYAPPKDPYQGKTPEQIQHLENISPLQRLGQPSDIAAVVSFLAGPDGAWVNGQTLFANGGAI